MKIILKRIFWGLMGMTLVLMCNGHAFADSYSTDFENFTLGNINGQNGWRALGSAGLGCALYDEGVSGSLGTAGFGSQSLRISSAVTSGCFSDQLFTSSLLDAAGETTAQPSIYATGTREPYFESQFDIASATPNAQQPGLTLRVSPSRGDGAPMSYLRFEDQADGIHVFFDDYEDVPPLGTVANPADGCGAGDGFVETDIATLDRSIPHTVKIAMNFVEGPLNDVVKVYIDGNLAHTGTSYEDYFRWCTESGGGVVGDAAADVTRTVDSLMFREGGTAAPSTSGQGFLIDNLSLFSGPLPGSGGGIISGGIPYIPGATGSQQASNTPKPYNPGLTNPQPVPAPATPPTVHPSATQQVPVPAPVPSPVALHPSAPIPSPTPNCQRTSASSIPFTDISNNWAKSYIQTLYSQCIIDGRTVTLFIPNGVATRAELVKIVFNMFGFQTSSYEKLFADVSANEWFAQDVTAAAKLGIVAGYQIGSGLPFFKPYGGVTRAEALAILLRSKGINNFGNYQTGFADVTKGYWFYSLIAYAQNKGIVKGYSTEFGNSGLVSNFYAFPRLLGFSNNGQDVENLKEIMTQLGYYHGEINMTYDAGLENAVSAYQTAKGIRATGQMGTVTRSFLLRENLTPKIVHYFSPNAYVTRSEGSKMAVLVEELNNGKVLGASTEGNWFVNLLLNYLDDLIEFGASR